jgi:hypothetical protein
MSSPTVTPLPAFLQLDQPPDPAMVPLQVYLLTLELAATRQRLATLGRAFGALGLLLEPPHDEWGSGSDERT